MSGVTENRTYGATHFRAVALGSAFAFVSLSIVVLVLSLNGTSSGGIAGPLIGIGVGSVAILSAVGMARTSLKVDDEGVMVRNFLSTRRVAWAQIERFDLPHGATSARLQLTDGQMVVIHALQPYRGEWLFHRRPKVQDTVDELNATLAEIQRESHGSPGGAVS